ncbi:MAG: PilZ domain-containing protein [Alphaproteobacteria bacterium]|nr:PilZ domain-containing protein [Alphaproteobacteria bacterium]
MVETTERSEARNTRRQRVLKGAKIVFNHSSSVIDCAVRDLSATGAKLVCSDQMAVPAEFSLVTPMDNEMRKARVIWRRDGLIGVEFVGEPRRAPPRKW